MTEEVKKWLEGVNKDSHVHTSINNACMTVSCKRCKEAQSMNLLAPDDLGHIRTTRSKLISGLGLCREDAPSKFLDIAKELGTLLDKKNEAYGDSFNKAGKILALLYPSGIKVEQYDDVLFTARVLDKLSRIASNPEAFNEDPRLDVAGYGILAVERIRRLKGEKP